MAEASRRSGNAVIWTIIGLNTAVFGAWTYAINGQHRDLVDKLQQNFTVSLQNWRQGRVWTVITSAFSHQGLQHFAFNMFSFYTLAGILAWVPGIGALNILALSLGSALLGSGAFLLQKKQQSDIQTHQRSSFPTPLATYQAGLGASGIVMGVGTAAACLLPFFPINIMFIPIGVPLWATMLLYVGVDTYFLRSTTSGIGHSAHLGGAVFGAVYYFAYLRRFGGVWSMIKRPPRY